MRYRPAILLHAVHAVTESSKSLTPLLSRDFSVVTGSKGVMSHTRSVMTMRRDVAKEETIVPEKVKNVTIDLTAAISMPNLQKLCQSGQDNTLPEDICKKLHPN